MTIATTTDHTPSPAPAPPHTPTPWAKIQVTALLVLADGTIIEGQGAGATGAVEAEICFNTALTGYQEIITDPSYDGQVVAFTFPHIGNVGANAEDHEDYVPGTGAVGAIFKADITDPSSYRSGGHFDAWLNERGLIAMSGVDTRALTAMIREKGLANGVIAHSPDGKFNRDELVARAKAWAGLTDADLAKDVFDPTSKPWSQAPWVWNEGFDEASDAGSETLNVVVLDYGVKRNILRLMAGLGMKLTVMPGDSTAEAVLAHKPDGVFISNGPGDPAATGAYAAETIRQIIAADVPLFGICLGHQMLALALGGKTIKMHQGHHGANHPVKDHTTGKVEIVSMNHGFAVDADSLPDTVEQTHVSLFDNTNCGLAVPGKPVFSVQHHPEASPGPQDSHYLFRRFANLIRERKGLTLLDEA
ncbi:MAG: glutamine-hydrolyzing carbamoyl-phosphate synthase small subunit [Pseudomonadota bacterium]